MKDERYWKAQSELADIQIEELEAEIKNLRDDTQRKLLQSKWQNGQMARIVELEAEVEMLDDAIRTAIASNDTLMLRQLRRERKEAGDD